jgi:hypothetical protein
VIIIPKGSGGGGRSARSGGGGGESMMTSASDLLPQGKSLGLSDIVHGSVDTTKDINIVASGNTFYAKEGLKSNSGDKTWSKTMKANSDKLDIQDTIYQAARWSKKKSELRFDLSN